MRGLLFISILFFYASSTYSLDLFAEPTKQHYRLGEKIEVLITIENRTSTRTAIPLVFACPRTQLIFEFFGERKLGPSWLCRRPIIDVDVVWIYPGGKYEGVIDINDYHILTKGQYTLRAVYFAHYDGRACNQSVRCLKCDECHTCNKYPFMSEEL